MTRRDYYDDPDAPAAHTIVPALAAFVLNEAGEVLLERRSGGRSDTGLWTMPGGAQGIGETVTAAVVRSVRAATGVDVEVTGLVGIYSDPGHVIAYGDGEVHQEFALCFRARPAGAGVLATTADPDGAHEVRWVPRAELAALPIGPGTRRRLDDAFAGHPEPVLV